MTATTAPQQAKQAAEQDAIRPFHVKVRDMELTELRNRIIATRWPDRETDASQGVQLTTMQERTEENGEAGHTRNSRGGDHDCDQHYPTTQ